MSQLDLEPDSLDRSGRQALADQVADAIEARIVSGRLRAGDRLPTTRDLAAALRVNRGTVQAAYRALSLSVIVTLAALAIFGYIKGRFTGAHALRSAAQTVVIGGVAAAAAFLLAKLIA